MKDGNAEIEDLLCESLGKAELTRLISNPEQHEVIPEYRENEEELSLETLS